jgi:hypothetical protein
MHDFHIELFYDVARLQYACALVHLGLSLRHGWFPRHVFHTKIVWFP